VHALVGAADAHVLVVNLRVDAEVFSDGEEVGNELEKRSISVSQRVLVTAPALRRWFSVSWRRSGRTVAARLKAKLKLPNSR
jgi:hypothetical protein